MTTARAFRSRCARKCSSRSSGSTTPATRMKAAPGSALRSRATSPAPMAATSRLATARWAACARQCEFRSKELLLGAGQQVLQLGGVLDVQLEAAAGHDDVAGLLVRLAGPQPFRLDLGHGIARRAFVAEVAVRSGRDRIGRIEIAGDVRMRSDRDAGNAADRIGHIAGRRLL